MSSEFPSKVRRRPTRVKLGDSQCDSNIVRASVLETALELGFGQNSTVANWIFNNPLLEDPEEPLLARDDQSKLIPKPDLVSEIPEATTPPFTSGSNSVSDESSSLNSPGNPVPSAAVTVIQVHMHKPSITEPPQVHFSDFSSDQLQLFSPFALSPNDPRHRQTGDNLLVNVLTGDDRSHSQDDILPGNHAHESPSPDAGYTSEGQYLTKGSANKRKDKPGKSKGNKGSKSKVVDSGKTSEKDGDYASDGGYLSASSNKSQSKSPSKVKSRAMAFFRRRPKKTASDDEDEVNIPPVPALPSLPRPSSPRVLERRATPSSPTRSGFSPLTLNLTGPPASPPRRRVSKSPPPVHGRTTPSKHLDFVSPPQRSASPLITSTLPHSELTPAAAAIPLPPSMPGTPISTTSLSSTSTPSTLSGVGVGSNPKSPVPSSPRQHLSIPPPAPPPTLPLPQPPPSPSSQQNGVLSGTQITPSRRRASTRPIPVAAPTGSTQPLNPHRTASPLRPLLSPRTIPPATSHMRNCEFKGGLSSDQLDGKEFIGRQRSATTFAAGFGSTPAFLQRKIQHGPPPSPRRPPPDTPLPPAPSPAASTVPYTPISSSKFHEHFSSVSSVQISQSLASSPSPSTATLSESSSGPSMRSSFVSSVSGLNEEPVTDLLNVPQYLRPTTRASTTSESSYGQPIAARFTRPVVDLKSRFSGRSDFSSSVYSSTMHRESSSVTAYDADDADVEDSTAPKSAVDEEDDASIYPPEDKTAGRRTMYLMEHGELDENGDEVVIAGSRYWGGHEVPPLPPLPPLPSMATRPRPGYF